MWRVAAAHHEFRRECRHARAAFVWSLESFRVRDPSQFWSFLKVPVPPPVPGLEAFEEHFRGLFGTGTSSSERGAWVQLVEDAEIPAFMASDVTAALACMAPGKSSGLARYSVDVLR